MNIKSRHFLLLAGLALAVFALIILLTGNIKNIKTADIGIDKATMFSEDILAIGSKTYHALLELQEYAYRFDEESYQDFAQNKEELFVQIDNLSGRINRDNAFLYPGGREEINVLFAGLNQLSTSNENLFRLLDQYREAVSAGEPQANLDGIDEQIKASYIEGDRLYDRLIINEKIKAIADNQTVYRDLLRDNMDRAVGISLYLCWALMALYLVLFFVLSFHLIIAIRRGTPPFN
jgi:hypothetical protein